PVHNPGDNWTFLNCDFEYLANGDVRAITHDAGSWSHAMTMQGCWSGDQTTTNAGSYITWAGYGLNVIGNQLSGRQVSLITAVTIDESGCAGIVITGNVWNNMYRGLDTGSTTGTVGLVYAGNTPSNPAPGFVHIAGTNIQTAGSIGF